MDASVQPRPPAIAAELTIEPLPQDDLWSIDVLARFLGVPKRTIYRWRPENYGPPAVRVGKHLRWRPRAVQAWVLEQERS